jgi:hypothetical protein
MMPPSTEHISESVFGVLQQREPLIFGKDLIKTVVVQSIFSAVFGYMYVKCQTRTRSTTYGGEQTGSNHKGIL